MEIPKHRSNVRLVGLCALALLAAGCARGPEARLKLREERFLKGRVFAEVRIVSQPKRLLLEKSTEPELNFATYRQSQARQVTGPFVLQTALRQPEIATLSLIKNQPDPIEWLEKNIVVDFPATEFMRISMKADDGREAAMIVNAVVGAYLTEVADFEQSNHKRRRVDLENALETLYAKNKVKMSRQRRLVEEIGASNDIARSQINQANEEFYDLARHELALEEFGRAKEEIQLARFRDKRPQGDDSAEMERSEIAEVEWLESSIGERTDRIAAWKRRLDGVIPNRTVPAGSSLELNSLQKEIEEGQAIGKMIREELLRLEVEMQNEVPRITLFRKADAP